MESNSTVSTGNGVVTSGVESTGRHIMTDAEYIQRQQIAYMKGYIIAASIRRGMKYHTTRTEKSAAFEMGHKAGSEDCQYDYAATYNSAMVTYNRLRHKKPHTGSVEQDDNWIKAADRQVYDFSGKMKRRLAEVAEKAIADRKEVVA